jgi:hypothetical protein
MVDCMKLESLDKLAFAHLSMIGKCLYKYAHQCTQIVAQYTDKIVTFMEQVSQDITSNQSEIIVRVIILLTYIGTLYWSVM